MAINLYLNFNGNSKEAVDYYSKVFKTPPPEYMYYSEMPLGEEFPMTDDLRSLVMHGVITIKDTRIMFADTPPDTEFTTGNNFSILLQSGDMEELKNFYTTLEKNGTVRMPMQETFFSKCFGSVTDKYGIEWQFYYEEE